MGNDQKDRFGDKLRDLEHAREEKFFAEREKEALEKLRARDAATKCPSCDEPFADQGGERVCPNGHRSR